MEENIAYDEGPVREVDQDGPRRRKVKEEESTTPQDVQEGTKIAHRISTVDTIAGMYALVLLSLGIAFPVSEYTSPSGDMHRRDALDTGFELYVFVVSYVIQVYLSMKTRILLFKQKKKKREENQSQKDGSRRSSNDPGGIPGNVNVYVVGDDIGGDPINSLKKARDLAKDVPWHKWHKVAPLVYHSKNGFNIFTRLGILIFGASAVAVEICRLVDFGQHGNNKCRYDAKMALIIIRMLFIMSQSFFLFIHHRVIFNFHHPLVKFGLLHMMGANLITWIKTVARDSVETYAIVSNTENNHTAQTHESSLADRLCLTRGSSEYRASNYLAPLVIEYCVLAAAILYRMYCNIGPSIYLLGEKPNIWELHKGEEKKNRWRFNIGLALGLPLFLATCGITAWNMVLSDKQERDMGTLLTQGRISVACNLTWNILIIIALFPAFYSVNKLRYERKDTGNSEHIMLVMLGGTFVFLGFITVASFMMLHDPIFGFIATMGIPGCLINFLQSVAMFVFVTDVYRRRVIDVRQPHGESAVTFLIFANISMWLVASFQWKYSFGSVLFFEKFGVLSWVLIVNSTLPLAMFYRFIICVLLMDVIRDTYGHRGTSKFKCVDFYE